MKEKQQKEHWLPLVHLFKHPSGHYKYEVSTHGNIRQRTKFGYKPVKVYHNCEGYCVVSLQTATGSFNRMYLHRIVAVVFLSAQNVSGSDTVNHRDENKDNNHINNLEWVSRSENIALAHKSGAIKNHGFKKHPVRISKLNKEYVCKTATQAAYLIGCSTHAIIAATKNHYKPKGWTVKSLVKPEVNGNIFTDKDFE